MISGNLHHPKMKFIDVGPGQTYTTAQNGGNFNLHGTPITGNPYDSFSGLAKLTALIHHKAGIRWRM